MRQFQCWQDCRLFTLIVIFIKSLRCYWLWRRVAVVVRYRLVKLDFDWGLSFDRVAKSVCLSDSFSVKLLFSVAWQHLGWRLLWVCLVVLNRLQVFKFVAEVGLFLWNIDIECLFNVGLHRFEFLGGAWRFRRSFYLQAFQTLQALNGCWVHRLR